MKDWPRSIDRETDFWNRGLASAKAASKALKVKNNVWTDVMNEQTLASVINSTTTGEWRPSMSNER